MSATGQSRPNTEGRGASALPPIATKPMWQLNAVQGYDETHALQQILGVWTLGLRIAVGPNRMMIATSGRAVRLGP